MSDNVVVTTFESSTLASIGYDVTRRICAVTFKSGHTWHYGSVDAGTWERFRDADSKGSFYAHHIKGRFPGKKMTGPCPKCGDIGVLDTRCTDCGTADYTDPQGHVPHAVLRPTRVMINGDGDAIGYERAQKLGFEHEVVYVRRDGWTLGTSIALSDTARRLWQGSWVQQWVNVGKGWELRWPQEGAKDGPR